MNEYLQDEREIKGYVEVEYSDVIKDNSDLDRTETFPFAAPIVENPLMIDDTRYSRVSQNYASLENDYFLLDGSFVLPDNNVTVNKNTGYIANDISNSYNITINFEDNDIDFEKNDGITIYFKDNLPNNVDFTFTNLNSEVITYNLTSDNFIDNVLNLKFDGTIHSVKSMNINIYNMEYNDRRLRINKIDYGLTTILRGSTLIKFKLIENIGDLNLEFPSNQITINFYDEDNLFDINNLSGYANLLNKKLAVKVKPYIGILTENDGIKYNNDLPIFFVENWNNKNREITLNCVDYLEKLKRTKNANRCGHLNLSAYNCTRLNNMIKSTLDDLKNVDTFENFENSQNYVYDYLIDTSNPLEYLQQLMIWLWGYIYSDDDKLIVNDRNNTEIYNNLLTLNTNLLKNPEYTIREPIKNITIICYDGYYTNDAKVWQSANVIYLTNSEKASDEIVELTEYHDLHVEASGISQDIGIQKIFNASEYIPAVSSPPTNITFYDLGVCTLMTSKYSKTFNEDGKEIAIDNKFFAEDASSSTLFLDDICESICNKINNENKKYDVSIDYVGDPNIKPNMIVPIETKYGEKQIKVLQHILTFDGGLTGSIKGVGD